jgi:LysM domain/CHAP domain
MTNAKIERFLTTSAGKLLNPDGAYGFQCKDVVDAYCLELFGDWVNTIRPGNAAVIFDQASGTHFTKFRNNPRDVKQIPARGDVVNWGPSRAVPEGHTGIVVSADQKGMMVLEQDGYAQTPAKIVWRGYTLPNGAVVVGWLRPKVPADRPAQCIVTAGDTMFTIARQFGVSLQGLINANRRLVPNPNVIRPGMVLTLP